MFGYLENNYNSVVEVIEHCQPSIFTNPILNHAWILAPSFVMWLSWKERNKRIFKHKEIKKGRFGKS